MRYIKKYEVIETPDYVKTLPISNEFGTYCYCMVFGGLADNINTCICGSLGDLIKNKSIQQFELIGLFDTDVLIMKVDKCSIAIGCREAIIAPIGNN